MLALVFLLDIISKGICVHHWVHHYSAALTRNSEVVTNLTERRAVATLPLWP